jgi:endonuclease/exonuclease/phosphatase family metal-dependent hydrolase
MRLVVRTWNVFHGNAQPPRRQSYLRAMVELASRDRPDVLCLQEVPVWSLPRLASWSGMASFGAVARPPLPLGPLPGWVTRLHQGRFRSGLAGQANAILVASGLQAQDLGHERISDEGRERRVVQALRLKGAPGVVVANLHATNDFSDPLVPRAEAARARAFVEGLARPGEPIVIAGDFNVHDPALEGYSAPGAGIDDVLVRGATVLDVSLWPVERRTSEGVVLSDHAPVDCVLEASAP